ncbi:MAG: guanylate kinase [Phycisphaerae bacterium]|jgi:guanylate kinase
MGDEKNGKLMIISGPSGVGKSTICKRLVDEYENVSLSVSLTTRPKSESEVNGQDYYFVTREEFEKKINAGELLEYAEVFGNFYGTPKDKVEQDLSQGKTVILEIDVQGARKVKTRHPEVLMVFILPPTQKELAARMNDRGRDDEQTSRIRLSQADDEIASAWRYYNNMVINEDLDLAVGEVANIAGLSKKEN